jgi:hypothetical protein
MGEPHARCISDLTGFDLKSYNGTVRSLVAKTVGWFRALRVAVEPADPPSVMKGLVGFRSAKARLKRAYMSDPPWNLVVEAAVASVPKLTSPAPLIATA